MLRNISLSCTLRIIIFAVLFSSASTMSVSGNTKKIKRITEPIFPSMLSENFPIKDPTIDKKLPGKDLFNLNNRAILALSKLANLRFENPAENQQKQHIVSVSTEKSSPLMASDDKVFGKNTLVEVPEKFEFKPRKFHCHPIEDIFIPAIDKMVPAYICKFEHREFIISSERFLEDNKHHLDVSVDETTFNRLLIPDDIIAGNSVANFIPVTLTQRKGDEFYGVKRT